MTTIKEVLIGSLLVVIAVCCGTLAWSEYEANIEEKKLAEETIDDLLQEIDRLNEMIARDDKLLDQFMHGTWNRECKYQLVADELLADGSVRSGLIQVCREDL